MSQRGEESGKITLRGKKTKRKAHKILKKEKYEVGSGGQN